LDIILEPGRVFPEVGPGTQTTVRVLRQLIHTYAMGVALPLTVGSMDTMLNAEIDTFSLDSLCALVELTDLHQVPALAGRLYQVLLRAVEQDLLFAIGWVCLLPRVLGVAATLNCWWDAAETHFQTALNAATRLDARTELGRTYLDYARMLAARDPKHNCQ